MAHNEEEVRLDRLYDLLNSISKYVEKKIRIYALGGTALTILGIKRSTLDIDINIEKHQDYRYMCDIFKNIGFEKSGNIRWTSQEGLRFDLFHGSNIMGTDLLPDHLSLSRFIRAFGNISLYTLSLEDIIISKLARGDDRDFDDIKMILDHNKINLKDLAERYKKTMDNSTVSKARQKFLDLIEIKFRTWGFEQDKNLISEVRRWELR